MGGGANAFTIVAPVNTTIENLYFENFHNSAIFGFASAGATIRNNKIQHPVGGFPAISFLPEEQLNAFGVSPTTPISFGILFLGNFSEDNHEFSISGTIRINKNEIEMSESTPDYPRMDLGMGLFIMNANLQVTSNTINTYGFDGIDIIDNFGSTTISGNAINGPLSGVWPINNCIEAGSGIFIPGNQAGGYVVDGNTMLVQDPREIGIMIVDQTVGAVVTKNNVKMHGGLSGISIWGGRDHVIRNNTISGYGTVALWTLPFNSWPQEIPDFSIENVSFVGNNITGFDPVPGGFHVWFGSYAVLNPFTGQLLFGPWTTNNCTLVGYSGEAFDDPLNSGNSITGYNVKKSAAGGSGIGPEMADAMHLRRTLLKNLKNII